MQGAKHVCNPTETSTLGFHITVMAITLITFSSRLKPGRLLADGSHTHYTTTLPNMFLANARSQTPHHSHLIPDAECPLHALPINLPPLPHPTLHHIPPSSPPSPSPPSLPFPPLPTLPHPSKKSRISYSAKVNARKFFLCPSLPPLPTGLGGPVPGGRPCQPVPGGVPWSMTGWSRNATTSDVVLRGRWHVVSFPLHTPYWGGGRSAHTLLGRREECTHPTREGGGVHTPY
jgi:hypothetical protein